ncbi:MAG: acyltransferase family protein [Deltaproteobacteria bacterium]|nr:acyltransferase family protein [Deltaproteobacteria bacterium]
MTELDKTIRGNADAAVGTAKAAAPKRRPRKKTPRAASPAAECEKAETPAATAQGDATTGGTAVPKPEEGAPGEGIVAEVLESIGGLGEELMETAGRVRSHSFVNIAGNLLSAARDLLTLDYYGRRLGELSLKDRSGEVDEFGLDERYWAKIQPLYEFLFYKYWRVALKGLANVPVKGRAILVANHAGTFAFDGVMLRVAVQNEHTAKRDVRFLVEDFIYHLPFAGTFMNRIGGVRACQENAERLLERGTAIATFPEGIQGVGKLFHDRYKLQRFGRGGVTKLAIRTKSPIVPVAIIGNEEIYPLLGKITRFAEPFGVPYIPLTPTFPWLGPLGLVPAPVKWAIHFGRPIDYSKYPVDSADDTVLVNKLTENLRARIQQMVVELLGERRSLFRG